MTWLRRLLGLREPSRKRYHRRYNHCSGLPGPEGRSCARPRDPYRTASRTPPRAPQKPQGPDVVLMREGTFDREWLALAGVRPVPGPGKSRLG